MVISYVVVCSILKMTGNMVAKRHQNFQMILLVEIPLLDSLISRYYNPTILLLFITS